MSKANKLISISTGALVAFLAGGAFWLSFDALKDLAAGNGIASGMAWLYPAIIDGAIIPSTSLRTGFSASAFSRPV
ncbi:MAG TPA: DUF2637 domain-containing protein [Chloroflexota bacterium]|nr:DUF2637 domain-containing protein [Chloroflexota bacterium]HUM67512.1 DUF2637 domain-containing protein [Chloroflexota bacterium]